MWYDKTFNEKQWKLTKFFTLTTDVVPPSGPGPEWDTFSAYLVFLDVNILIILFIYLFICTILFI